ncbi:hypothetical protein [Xanthomonas campestris]|uniref:hypothetical protein n=1 Tax=Xanthomonas campestris TaxID=339 RepID=UPI00237853F8|nr:hypothetical protein [Xanthomonas campestris]WDL17946.1 hypothetical protein JH285_00955 [Xanthomonas campestris pv. campestris]WDL22029.1 hypothetical protein JH268_01005 [Xanthomonas campestris pv. campestris]WDL25895.1 hypothetical protein JH276_20810 [Xanthomonas campestris pv. campestris]WDL30201.1 hypothetical protein JH297_01000 [Xanthomonas campestris pv. campestris]WDL34072.1 hypothetical protein JH255_20875 [Xanthomonas campestris pv. campestris]
MSKNERDIFHYDAMVRTWNRKYNGLPVFPHFEIARAIALFSAAGKAEIVRKNLTATYVTEIKLYNDRCEMLIGFSDTNAADPTFNDHPAKKRRVVAKVGNEGLEHSAHVVWYYKSKTNAAACEFYLEGAVGLSSAAVVKFLNNLVRNFCQANKNHFSLPDPSGAMNADGTHKAISVRPVFELRGHPSSEFIRDLKSGEIGELELITESKNTKVWDSHGYAVEEHRGVLLKPSAQKHVPAAKAFIDGVLSAAVKKDYEKSRVVFKTSGNLRKDVKFYTSNYQLVNDLKYIKKSKIKNPIGKFTSAFNAINIFIVGEVRKIASPGIKLSNAVLTP